jgi:cobaltochelatase CobN
MKAGGYAGAREMMDNLENLYGWQMTSPEQMDSAFWQNSYDVYIADKHGLALEQFFERARPTCGR